MTIVLPSSLEQRLREEARRLGLSADEYAAQLVAQHLPPEASGPSLAELFAQWDVEDQTDDPVELARRHADFEEFKRSMNRNRIESEGPNARIPFP